MNKLSIIFPSIADGCRYLAHIGNEHVEGTEKNLRTALKDHELRYIKYRTPDGYPPYRNFCYYLDGFGCEENKYKYGSPYAGAKGIAKKKIFNPYGLYNTTVEQLLDVTSDGTPVKRTALASRYGIKGGTIQTFLEDGTQVVLRQKKGGEIISGYTFNPRTLISSVYKDGKFVLPDGKEIAKELTDAIRHIVEKFPIKYVF